MLGEERFLSMKIFSMKSFSKKIKSFVSDDFKVLKQKMLSSKQCYLKSLSFEATEDHFEKIAFT